MGMEGHLARKHHRCPPKRGKPNLNQIAAWFAGRPLAPTRTSRFAALAA